MSSIQSLPPQMAAKSESKDSSSVPNCSLRLSVSTSSSLMSSSLKYSVTPWTKKIAKKYITKRRRMNTHSSEASEFRME